MQLDIVPSFSWPRFPKLSSWLPSWLEEEDWPLSQKTISGLSMSEDERNLYIEAALPGIDPKDIEVTFDKGVLWIRGEAKEEGEEGKQRKYYRKSTRSFSYRTVIPEAIDDAAEPEVTSKNGLLMVTFAKAAQVEPKKLKVKT